MKPRRSVAIFALAAFSQTACYSSYFITKSELEKLESTAEQKEVVTVFGDCPEGTTAYKSVLHGTMWAQAPEVPAEGETKEEASDDLPPELEEVLPPEEEETPKEVPDANTATPEETSAPMEKTPTNAPPGCQTVAVSTGNPLQIVTKSGKKRVTPFNFIMNGGQIVSPEYNLLENLSDVDGAEVSQFSTWKTVGTIVVVSALAIGTFVGISLLAPTGEGFQD